MDDLDFDTPEAAAKCAIWMRTRTSRSVSGFTTLRGGMCALGAAGRACGYQGFYQGNDEELDLPFDAALNAAGLCHDAVIAVGVITTRQAGISPPAGRDGWWVHELNDCDGITFPQFATACRTLAAMIEERYVVESAPVAEPALVEA